MSQSRQVALRRWIVALAVIAVYAVPMRTVALQHVTGRWVAIPPLPADVVITTAVGGNDAVLYVFGICQSTCRQANGTIVTFGAPVSYMYEEDTGWRRGRPAPRICDTAQASAYAYDNTVRLAGCWSNQVTNAGFRIAVYDTFAKTWQLKAAIGPYVDPIAGMVDANGRVLWYSQSLRRQGSAVFVNGHRIVQSLFGTWYRRAMEPADGPSDGAAIGSDGKVYVVGGSRQCLPQLGTCEVPAVAAWTPRTNRWSRPTSLPTPRIRVAVTADADGNIFTAGGISGNGSKAFDTVEIYRPEQGTWAGARRLPAPRVAAIATSTPDGRTFVLGGYDQDGQPMLDGWFFIAR